MKFVIMKALSGNLTVKTLFLLLKLLELEDYFAKRISTIGRGEEERNITIQIWEKTFFHNLSHPVYLTVQTPMKGV